MDILKEIEKQIASIKAEDDSALLDQIYSHLDRAELYYKNGQSDEQYFNDVIYRSNQAYEGALKEAFKVLADKSDTDLSKTTLHKIEAHLKDNNIFRERVLQLFENYRQEWRNKSTHDYKLVFKEDEAFIALMSVSSFVHLLLKEIAEKIAFNKQLKIKNAKAQHIRKLLSDKERSLLDKITELISESNELLSFDEHKNTLSEVEILGTLHAYLSKSSDQIKILREPTIRTGEWQYRPDFIVEMGDEKIVFEIKRFFTRVRRQNAIHQMLAYLKAAETTTGILYYATPGASKSLLNVEKHVLNVDGKDYLINIIDDRPIN